jgi:hypothetical protein
MASVLVLELVTHALVRAAFTMLRNPPLVH